MEYLTPVQRRVAAGLIMIVAAALIAGWVSAVRGRIALRESERALSRARQDAKEALKAAAEIAQKMKAVNEQLLKLEEKRSEELEKYDSKSRDARDLRDRYDRARRERGGAADAELGQLCLELEGLGYPCDAGPGR